MYQSVFPPPWRPSLTVLAAFCFCDFLRTGYKSAALVHASPVSRNLAVHRRKQNSVTSAFPPSKGTFCLMVSSFSSFILWLYSVFIANCPWLGEQPGTFNLLHLTAKTDVSSLHRCRNWNAKSKIRNQQTKE